jgi:hypothetical protein
MFHLKGACTGTAVALNRTADGTAYIATTLHLGTDRNIPRPAYEPGNARVEVGAREAQAIYALARVRKELSMSLITESMEVTRPAA